MSFSKVLWLLLVFPLSLLAQKKNNDFNYYIHRATSAIKVDGIPTEQAWNDAAMVTDFFQVLPMDTSRARVATQVKLCYDDKNLYVLFVNLDTLAGSYVVESMKRDWVFSRNDNDLLFIDTYNDLTTGFSFGSNAVGGQWDGLMANGSNIDVSWENKWQSETSYNDDVWIWEAAIPFKTLRYKADAMSWGINFSRNDLKSTEKSSWTPIPRQFPTASLAFTGNLVWDVPPPKPGANISIIPYIAGRKTTSFVNQKNGSTDKNIGFDAKIGLGPAMNLDLTVNPDFSQVDVDVQQTNLDRFELFFPERRQFFLENGDLFNNFGYSNIRPFFSRRIGLNSPLIFGSRISGKITKKMRIGGMMTQTGQDDQDNPGALYSVFALQQQVFKRSNITGIFINKDLSTNSATDTSGMAAYNRTLGLEYNLASANNKWKGKAFVLHTYSPFASSQNNVWAGNLGRITKNISVDVKLESVGEQVQGNETGYIQRKNYYSFNPSFNYLFFPKKGKVLSHGPGAFLSNYYDRTHLSNFEYLVFLNYEVTMKDRSLFSIWTAKDYVKLQSDFDPTNYTGYLLKTGQVHEWHAVGAQFTSKPQKLFTYSASTRAGGYYAGGERFSLNTTVGYRFQPYVALAMSTNYNRIMFNKPDSRLPALLQHSVHNLWLVGPKVDITLTNKLFFSNFLQYNSQANNVNFYSRFQWRYSPASDLFLVYTDNYTADNFQVKNRSIVLKFTYWWNV